MLIVNEHGLRRAFKEVYPKNRVQTVSQGVVLLKDGTHRGNPTALTSVAM